jgi:molybdenum cofactor cytidylyltransferase
MATTSFQSFAIVPAAGVSRRMGQPKLLLPLSGRTLIEHVLTEWLSSRVNHVVLVVRPDDQEVAAIGGRLGVDVVVPPTSPADMKASVAHALARVAERHHPADHDAWLLAPADMPRLHRDVINGLLAAHRLDQPRMLAPVASGRRGHPTLFPWRLAQAVRTLPEGTGVDWLVRTGPVEEIEVGDVGIHDDLDHPEDYARLR